MATLPAVPNGAKKLSFAKVAASRSKEQSPISNALPFAPVLERRDQNLVPTTTTSTAAPPAHLDASAKQMRPGESAAARPAGTVSGSEPCAKGTTTEDKVVEGLKDLKLEVKMPSLVVNGSGSTTTERSSKAGNSQTPSDDNSQRADSNSELGTKPPSLDGKSITSGTTFALDEKESLRPDDSASVMAAAEDDDAFSIRGSLIAGSRMGSEVAGRVRQIIQLGDMPPRTITTLVSVQTQGHATPQSGASEKQPATNPAMPLDMASAGTDSLTSDIPEMYSKNPDEKLLEAMQTQKDRFFLLQLEQRVIEFVQNSKEPFMDLPPSNSFCRMLTHKLADYYHMTHSFEPVGAVRIYRTPFCRIPPSLSSIVVSTPSSNSPAPGLLPRKIMRRGEDGEFALASANPSKPTSEAGSDPKGKVAKEKLTREEREEAYNRARESIFGANVEKTEASTPEGDDINGMSRASSVSAKDKSNAINKRKPPKSKRDDSEGFDTRSSYMVINGVQQPTWAATSQQYYQVGNPAAYSGQFAQQPYQGAMQTWPGNSQPYPQMMPQNAGYSPQYNGMPSYPPQPPVQPMQQQQPMQPPAQQQRFPPTTTPMTMPYSAAVPNVPQPGWQAQQNFNQNQYPVGRAPNSQPSSGGIPYPFGQLPVNNNPMDPKTQHPIPGSYNRQPFNPKTQSFVPGNGMVPMPPPVPYGSPTPHHGSPQFSNPLLNYNNYQPPMPPPGGYPGNGSGYSMTRQGSNNSIPPYHPAQQVHQQPMAPGQVPPQKHMLPNPPPHIPSKPVVPQGHGPQQTFSTLPNYGNPATLPQKPPPT